MRWCRWCRGSVMAHSLNQVFHFAPGHAARGFFKPARGAVIEEVIGHVSQVILGKVNHGMLLQNSAEFRGQGFGVW